MTLLFRSLTFRVIAFSTVWAVLALIVIATVISTLYRAGQRARLRQPAVGASVQPDRLGRRRPTAGQLTGSPDLGDLRFSEPESGWYWSVEPVSGGADRRAALDLDDQADCLAAGDRGSVQPGLPAQLHRGRHRRRGDRSVRERVRARQQEPRRAFPGDGQSHRAGERDRQLPAPARDLSRRVRHRHDRHQRDRHPARPAAAAARAPGAGAGARGQCAGGSTAASRPRSSRSPTRPMR